MHLSTLLTLLSLPLSLTLTHVAPLGITVPGLTKPIDVKLPALPIALPIVGGGASTPATGASGQAGAGDTTVATPNTGTGTSTGASTPVSPPDLLNQLNQFVGALKPVNTVQEAVVLVKKIQEQVELAVITTVGALKTK